MKRISYLYKKVCYITSSKTYKIILLINILFSFFFCFSSSTNEFVGQLLYNSMNSYLFSMYLFFMLMFNTILTLSIYDRSTESIIRYKNKKIYFQNMVITIIFSNFIGYLIFLLTFLIFAIIVCGGCTFGIYPVYNLPMGIYLLYFGIKLFLLTNFYCILSLILIKGFNFKLGIIIGAISFFIKDIFPIYLNSNAGITNFKFNINYYFYSFPHTSFFEEILYFIMEFLLLLVIIIVIYHLIMKYRKRVIEVLKC